ncbi:MAG: hypothetical protein ACRETY_08420 [Steroidobacteraceae bacterium]
MDFAALPTSVERHFQPSARGTRYEDRPNLDGWMIVSSSSAGTFRTLQCFRDGAVEMVRDIGSAVYGPTVEGERKRYSGHVIEGEIVDLVTKARAWCELVDVSPPLIVYVTLTGVVGQEHSRGGDPYDPMDAHFDRDVVSLPGVVVSEEVQDVPRALRPVLDMVWQAAGWTCSPNFTKEGDWKGREQ